MKKVRVFLGGYINSSNAQNLNCLALTRYLDKEKFDVYTLELYSGNLDNPPICGVKTFRCFYPHKISKYIGYLWGIYHCNVAYLPKGEIDGWNHLWLKLLRKKSFKTVEGILDKKNLESTLVHWGSYEKFIASFKYFDRVYSITKYLKEYNFNHHNIQSENALLYLGSDIDTFTNFDKSIIELKNIIYIGRVFKRKGIYDFLDIAKNFPDLNFHIVGEGDETDSIKQIIELEKLHNITIYGRLNHEELANLLRKMELHLFPSRSEGFPKVTLETAAAGVPSLVYSDYGASEWITDHKDGFVVDTLDEMKAIIENLINNQELLRETSKNAISMAKQFDWKILVKEWEDMILCLVIKK